jgi:hypothetical protein
MAYMEGLNDVEVTSTSRMVPRQPADWLLPHELRTGRIRASANKTPDRTHDRGQTQTSTPQEWNSECVLLPQPMEFMAGSPVFRADQEFRTASRNSHLRLALCFKRLWWREA